MRGAKYFLVAVVTVPVEEDIPLVESLRGLGLKELGEKRPVVEDEAGDEALGDEPGPDDPLDQQVEEREELSEGMVREAQRLEQQWKEFIGDRKSVKVNNNTLAVLVKSRHSRVITDAMAQFYSRLRALSIPVFRIHSDRATEFLSKDFKVWYRDRSLYHTFTAGDEPAGNGRVESELGILKGRTRALMRSSGVEQAWWPLVLRHASEARFREQMRCLAIPSTELLPFRMHGIAKKKVWHNRCES